MRRQHVARHVFVDDSGRRRRVTQALGVAIAVVMCAYIVVVGLAFSGATGPDGVGLGGLDDLANPADQQQAEVGADPIESPAPTAPAEPGASTVGPSSTSTPPPSTSATTAPPTTSPATTVPPTTTTTRPGNGNSTPNSTVPGHGPPTSRPDKP